LRFELLPSLLQFAEAPDVLQTELFRFILYLVERADDTDAPELVDSGEASIGILSAAGSSSSGGMNAVTESLKRIATGAAANTRATRGRRGSRQKIGTRSRSDGGTPSKRGESADCARKRSEETRTGMANRGRLGSWREVQSPDIKVENNRHRGPDD
jgi:hypothetical protein